ncbi:MAG TPA: serine hydrolase domain-containing protein [Candidatus Sulfotelmatobacter sp.]|nr:serine hydrolase domain-containing protein [Candidatus Sulfotelmatobacter sp.]
MRSIAAAETVAPKAVGLSAKRLARLTDAFERDVAAGAIPGAVVLIARKGRTAYLRAFGYRDREAEAPMALDTIFRAASMTKPMVVVAALMLAEEGRLQTYHDLADYLPEWGDVKVGIERGEGENRTLELVTPRRAITVQDLMRHTSGLTYGAFGDSLVQRAYRAANVTDPRQTNAEMSVKLAALPLASHPGSTWEYGMSIDVLGRVVEVVSGMSLDAFVAERITGPLAMHDTAFRLPEGDDARLAWPQVDPGTGERPDLRYLYDPVNPPRWIMGGGGLLSTAGDYARFAHALAEGGILEGTRILARSSVALMTADHLPPQIAYAPWTARLGISAPLPELGQGFGLGVAVRTAPGRNPSPGSVGDWCWSGISGTYFWVDPAEELVTVLMLQAPLQRIHYRALLRDLVYQAVR